jgi:hypothetical protein
MDVLFGIVEKSVSHQDVEKNVTEKVAAKP